MQLISTIRMSTFRWSRQIDKSAMICMKMCTSLSLTLLLPSVYWHLICIIIIVIIREYRRRLSPSMMTTIMMMQCAKNVLFQIFFLFSLLLSLRRLIDYNDMIYSSCIVRSWCSQIRLIDRFFLFTKKD